tara:strand:+ start:1564 stop:1848 length:285 start_codon:yes stop_codon:yes gene_type:complete
MPYIKTKDREKFDDALDIISNNLLSMGDFNYCISKIMDNYLNDVKEVEGSVGYYYYNNLVGVLECAKLELYRRLAAPYEDLKIEDNGDVYNATS